MSSDRADGEGQDNIKGRVTSGQAPDNGRIAFHSESGARKCNGQENGCPIGISCNGRNSNFKRFSSIEPRSPTTPAHSDSYQPPPPGPPEYDDVFPDVPPTPGTAPALPSKHMAWSRRKLRTRDVVLLVLGIVLVIGLAVGIPVAVIIGNTDSPSALIASTDVPIEEFSSNSSPSPSSTPSPSSLAEVSTSPTSLPTSPTALPTSPTSTPTSTSLPTSPAKSPSATLPTSTSPTSTSPTSTSPTSTSLTSTSLTSTSTSPTSTSPTSTSPTSTLPTTSPLSTSPTSTSPTSTLPTTSKISTPSTLATSTLLSSSSSDELHYDGHLNLSSPLEATEVELETSFVHDMKAIIDATPLSKSFIRSSLINVSANEKLTFSLDFKRSLLELVSPPQEEINHSLARTVQIILQNQVVSGGNYKLPIKADSIVIIENIPMTTPVSTPQSSVSSSESTTGTQDSCLSLSFEPCHSLLGSSTYYLPNLLHHKTALQAEDAYHELSGQTVNTSCSDSALFYLCSFLFPSCDDPNNVPLLPCDTLCNVVTKDCGDLHGWPQNCQELPTANCRNLNVVLTSTSTTEPTTAKQPGTTVTQPSVLSTANTLSETTQESVITTIKTDFACVPFNFSVCNALGLKETMLPSYVFQCHDVQCLIQRFNEFSEASISSGCAKDLTFFCAYTFRGCNQENSLDIIGPCFNTCLDAVDRCGEFMPYQVDCDKFDRPNSPCISPHPAPITTPEPPLEYNCVDLTHEYCASTGLKRVRSDMLNEGVKEFEKWALPTIESGCSPLAKFFYCGIFFPVCEEGKNLSLPCRKYCEEVNAQCPQATFPVDCSGLEEEESRCLTPGNNPHSTAAPPLTTVSESTNTNNPRPQCVPLETSSLCSEFGYNLTSFPNLWGDSSAREANKTYYMLAERSVATNCSSNILFYVCSMLFPACEGEGIPKLPCTNFCEEVNEKCPLLFKQDCDQLSSSNPDQCLSPPVRRICPSSEFSCANINKCVPLSATCNKVNDCGDWSDERHCECHPEFEVQCAMGLCIPSYNQCDGVAHCPDNSDEFGCKCPKNQYKCDGDGPCIMPEWLCDGQLDCTLGDDEEYCRNCGEDDFTCVDHTCIPWTQECDGVAQCPDHTDEMDCIYNYEANNPFFMKIDKEAVLTCAEGFTDVHGHTTCLKMGHKSLKSWTKEPTRKMPSFFQLDPNGNIMSIIGRGKSVSKCPGEVVAVECYPKECGHPADNLPPFLINGKDALPGIWPWMVSVRKYEIHQCGGAIIHPYFILTASHCIDSSLDYKHMHIYAGTSRLSQLGPHGQKRKVRRAITYPGYKQMTGNDIALLELEEPLTNTDYIKPLCLPEDNDVFTRANPCVIVGWGHTKGIHGETSEHQQEAKMTLWDTQKCNSSFVWNGYLKKNEMCAGYYNGLMAACSGDSGSPVACQDETKTWKAVGVASYVYKTCSVATKPLVYTPTQPYLEWINNHTVCQFTCDDGICLFDKGMLCDTVADCKDRSDEINQCDVSPNCTFSDRFMCGYRTAWHMVSNGGADAVNRYPLFDRTVGKYPGKFLLGKNREADLQTPRIDLDSAHCMRFHFHMRGPVENGMGVTTYNLVNKKWDQPSIWDIGKQIGPDRWMMGLFDLGPGHYEMVYRTYDDRRFSLDDFWLLEGTCENMTCFDDEFMCETFGVKNCLPLAVKCNLVFDCDEKLDEMGCEAPSYTCDFENGNICGLEQHTDDTEFAEWVFVNSSSTPHKWTDHTFQNESGTMLLVKTESLLENDQVKMSQELVLGPMEYCLKFFYASTSPVTLQVTLEHDFRMRRLLKFTNRKTEGWIPTQVTLQINATDDDEPAKLTYTVIGGELGLGTVERVIMLDDITITPGACPPFTCPPRHMLCEGEAYCVAESKVCDRILDCNNATDEAYCTCTASEFKCPRGPCIPSDQACNLVPNCPDGSDEGATCDHKRSISCDFEDPFLCGYKTNSSVKTFHWRQARGKIGDALTGAYSDHTYMTQGSLVGFYVVADIQFLGEFTALESPPFVSTGTGLVFYYHARHAMGDAWMTGRLSLMITFLNNGTKKHLWSDVPGTLDVWKSTCQELPVGNISFSLVVQSGSGYKAYIAVDDVQLLTGSCDEFLTDGRISGGEVVSTPAPQAPTPAGCPENKRACRSGMCLSIEMFCDGVNDCQDNSDEFDCPTPGQI